MCEFAVNAAYVCQWFAEVGWCLYPEHTQRSGISGYGVFGAGALSNLLHESADLLQRCCNRGHAGHGRDRTGIQPNHLLRELPGSAADSEVCSKKLTNELWFVSCDWCKQINQVIRYQVLGSVFVYIVEDHVRNTEVQTFFIHHILVIIFHVLNILHGTFTTRNLLVLLNHLLCMCLLDLVRFVSDNRGDDLGVLAENSQILLLVVSCDLNGLSIAAELNVDIVVKCNATRIIDQDLVVDQTCKRHQLRANLEIAEIIASLLSEVSVT